jgi:hypothetical protein
MDKLALLLLDHPSAVLESGVVIPCAMRDLLAMALEDLAADEFKERPHSFSI